jgi:hypothetical protein
VLYATAGVANDAVRIIGYCDFSSGLATVGSWASACTTTQVFGAGIKKPGDVVQSTYGVSSVQTTGNTTTNVVTVPAASITPTSSINFVKAHAEATIVETGSAFNVVTQIFRAAGSSAACTTAVGPIMTFYTGVGGAATQSILTALDAPQSSAQQSYAACIKATGAANHLYCVGGAGTNCSIELQEIMGAIDPANDNGMPLIMTG